MKHLLLSLCLLGTACVSDPVDVSLSYLEADKGSYEVVAPSMEALLSYEAQRPLEDRAVNPWTGQAYSDEELGSLQLVLDSWALRLEGAGVTLEAK